MMSDVSRKVLGTDPRWKHRSANGWHHRRKKQEAGNRTAKIHRRKEAAGELQQRDGKINL